MFANLNAKGPAADKSCSEEIRRPDLCTGSAGCLNCSRAQKHSCGADTSM